MLPQKTDKEIEELEQYIRDHNITEILEAILTGLAVVRPPDSISYIHQNMGKLKDLTYSEIQWDMLVPQSLRPKKRIISPSAFDFILNNQKRFNDIGDIAPELYDRACHHYNSKILRMTFKAMKLFIEVKRRMEAEAARKLAIAVNYNNRNLSSSAFSIWKKWAKTRLEKSKEATEKMRTVLANYVQQVIFDSWYTSAVEAKKTREYFERLERGDVGENEQMDEGEPHEEGNDAISLLPIEAAARIFSQLPLIDMVKCSLVCRSWKVIIQSSALWNKVDLSEFGSSLNDNILISLLSIGRPFVVHVNLKGCDSLTSRGFGFIAQCRNLQDVNLSSTNITDEVIEDIGFSSGSQILYLNLSNTAITDKSLRSMCNFMPHLQYLNIGFCQMVTDKGLYYLSKGRVASTIRHIDISGCINITSNGFKYMGRSFTNLRSFYCNNSTNIDNECLQLLFEGCKKIRSVSLRFSPNISDESLILLSTLKHLTWLRIEGNARVSDRTIGAVGEKCEQLRHFYVSDCGRITEISLRSIALCKAMVVVNLADCIRVNDAAVRAIVEGPSGPIIRELNLTNCIRVSDVSLLRIAQRCGSLRYLSLCHLENITEAGLEFVANIHNLYYLDLTGCNVQDGGIHNLSGIKRLKHVNLIANTQITDLGIQKFVSSVAEIESINVSFCMALSDGAFKNIAYSCRKLTVLGLAGCTLVGDMTIQYISGACPFLKQLDISGCVDLTDKSLKFVRKGCRQLRVLLMLYCRNMTKATVSKLKASIEVVEWSSNIPPPAFKFHLNSVANLVVSNNEDETNTNQEQT